MLLARECIWKPTRPFHAVGTAFWTPVPLPPPRSGLSGSSGSCICTGCSPAQPSLGLCVPVHPTHWWFPEKSERSLFAFPGALAMKKGKTCYLFISHENKSTMVQKQIYANCQETKFQVTETKWTSFSNCICSNTHFLNYPLPWCYMFTGTKTCYRRAHGSFRSGVKVVVY